MRDYRPTGPGLAFPHTLLVPASAAGVLTGLWLERPGSGWAAGAGSMAAGLVAWTLAEYVLHRFILHGFAPFRPWHLAHHRQPEVPMRTPLLFSLLLVLGLAVLPSVAGAVLGVEQGVCLAFSVGLVAGHGTQECVHAFLHRPLGRAQGWFAARWRHHDFHHHECDALAFGTQTSVWDRLLGTAAWRE